MQRQMNHTYYSMDDLVINETVTIKQGTGLAYIETIERRNPSGDMEKYHVYRVASSWSPHRGKRVELLASSTEDQSLHSTVMYHKA